MNTQHLNINYIRHLNAFYDLIHEHERLRANDISLYMALFHLWNQRRFPVTLTISRRSVLNLSGIGSNRTYVQCLKRLDKIGLITYKPSHNPFLESIIKMAPLDKSEPRKHEKIDPHTCSNKAPAVCVNFDPHTGAILHHINNKQINNFINERQTTLPQKKDMDKIPPGLEEVRGYFKAAAQPEKEADRFYFHYKALGWTLSGMPILDWQAAAEKWIGYIPSLKININANTISTRGLQSGEHKRYDESL